MIETVFGYMLASALSAAFGAVYFTWLKSSMDKILEGRKKPSYIHVSFALRMLFAIIFFRVMLVYFSGIWDVCAMILGLVAARYAVIKRENRK